jgi:hypothetical protein
MKKWVILLVAVAIVSISVLASGEGEYCDETTACDQGLECSENLCVENDAEVTESQTNANSNSNSNKNSNSNAKSKSNSATNANTQSQVQNQYDKRAEKLYEKEQRLLAVADTQAFVYDATDESYAIYVYDTPIIFSKDKIKSSWLEGFLIKNENLLVYDTNGNGFTSQRMVVSQDGIGGLYNIKSLVNGKLQDLDTRDLNLYGIAIGSADSIPIYTYSAKSDLKLIIGPYLVTISENGPIAYNVQAEVSECSDTIDNEGDGFVDYTGICEVSPEVKYVCFCDLDYSGGANEGEYMDESLCGIDSDADGTVDDYSNYFCESQVDYSITQTTCPDLGGTYYWYDEACPSAEGEEGDNSCVSQNVVEMGIVCQDTYGIDPELCLQLYGSDMEVLCQGDESTPCVSQFDCGQDEVCDNGLLTCVDAGMSLKQNLAQGLSTNFCKISEDCSTKGTVCKSGICVEDLTSKGTLTYDNPVFGWAVKGADTINFALNKDDLEFQEGYMKKQAVQNAVLEKKIEEGDGFKQSLERAQVKSVDNMVKSIDSQTLALKQKFESGEVESSSGYKVQAMKLSMNTAMAGKNAAKLGPNSDQSQKMSKAIKSSGEDLGNFMPKVVQQKFDVSDKISKGEIKEFGKDAAKKRKSEETEAKDGESNFNAKSSEGKFKGASEFAKDKDAVVSLPPGLQAQLEGRISSEGKSQSAAEAKKTQQRNFQNIGLDSVDSVSTDGKSIKQMSKTDLQKLTSNGQTAVSQIRKGDFKGDTENQFVPSGAREKLQRGEKVAPSDDEIPNSVRVGDPTLRQRTGTDNTKSNNAFQSLQPSRASNPRFAEGDQTNNNLVEQGDSLLSSRAPVSRRTRTLPGEFTNERLPSSRQAITENARLIGQKGTGASPLENTDTKINDANSKKRFSTATQPAQRSTSLPTKSSLPTTTTKPPIQNKQPVPTAPSGAPKPPLSNQPKPLGLPGFAIIDVPINLGKDVFDFLLVRKN